MVNPKKIFIKELVKEGFFRAFFRAFFLAPVFFLFTMEARYISLDALSKSL
jgi:hypothetical protein